MLSRLKEIEKCPNFLTCSAPMCLFDPKVEICCWHPDEEICKRNFPPQWIKNQKKIKKRTRSIDTYYTFKMLERNCVIGKGIVGILPEGVGHTSIEVREKNWLRKHPKKRILTEKEKKIIGERLKQGRKSR